MAPDGWVTDPGALPSDKLVEFKNPYSYMVGLKRIHQIFKSDSIWNPFASDKI